MGVWDASITTLPVSGFYYIVLVCIVFSRWIRYSVWNSAIGDTFFKISSFGNASTMSYSCSLFNTHLYQLLHMLQLCFIDFWSHI